MYQQQGFFAFYLLMSQYIFYNDDFILDNDKLKLSAISGKIHIINNSGWVDFRNDGDCTGSGTYTDPYIIEDLVIDGGGSGSCILIENSDIYFKIENCSVFNSGNRPAAGIRLSYVNNSQLIDNNCSSNRDGIKLGDCYNTTITGNTANDNYLGIHLDTCNYSIVSGNTANNNNRGIRLAFSHHNIVSGNTANFNTIGIVLTNSDFNTISGNILRGNDLCIVEEYCEGNNFKNNDCGEPGMSIPSYNPIFLLGILSAVTIILINKIKKF